MVQFIQPQDLMFYGLERHDSPKHVGALLIYEIPEDASQTYMQDLVCRLRQIPVVEPFNRRPYFPLLGLPQWQTVGELEMTYHLRHSALAAPGSTKQLIEAVQRLNVGVMDRRRPGWICHVIEGLEDNRFAIFMKIHHAYVDGMSAVTRLYGSMSSTPSADINMPWGEISHIHASNDVPEEKSRSVFDLFARAFSVGEFLSSRAKITGELNIEILRIAAETLKLSNPSGHVPFAAPQTRLNEDVDSDLRSVGIVQLPLDGFLSVCKAVRCTANDLLLSLIDASLQDYLRMHGESPTKPLVAMIPMSVRCKGDYSATTQIAALLVEMGDPKADLKDRIAQVARSAFKSKKNAAKMSQKALMDFVLVMLGSLELIQRMRLQDVLPATCNVVVSNVLGSKEEQLYLGDAKLLASHPISTLAPGANINVTAFSHGNCFDFGIVADHRAIPDIDVIADGVKQHFAELSKKVL